MIGRTSPIDKYALDLMAMLVWMRKFETYLLEKYVWTHGDLDESLDSLADYVARELRPAIQNPTPEQSASARAPRHVRYLMVQDECPDGWHDDGTGVCVPD